MIGTLLATTVVLVTVIALSKREIEVGPVYLLIPISAFGAGCYWSLRRSSRPKDLAKPPSIVLVVVKSATVGILAVILSLIAYVTTIWALFLRKINGHGSIGFVVVGRYWWAMAAIFLAAFVLEYRRASKSRSRWSGMGH
jgi:hypothetical protein